VKVHGIVGIVRGDRAVLLVPGRPKVVRAPERGLELLDSPPGGGAGVGLVVGTGVVLVVGTGVVLVSVGVVLVSVLEGVATEASTGPGGGSILGLAVRKFSATKEPSASCVIDVMGTSVASCVKVLPPSTERWVRSRSGKLPESTCSLKETRTTRGSRPPDADGNDSAKGNCMNDALPDRLPGSTSPLTTVVSPPMPNPVTDGAAMADVAIPATNRLALATALTNFIYPTADPSPRCLPTNTKI